MSGLIAKSQIKTVEQSSLPTDAQMAIVQFKNALRAGQFKPFDNRKDKKAFTGKPLPKLSNGCTYVEADVGRGRVDRGNRRLVAEIVQSNHQIREIYFTDDHYSKGSFVRVI